MEGFQQRVFQVVAYSTKVLAWVERGETVFSG